VQKRTRLAGWPFFPLGNLVSSLVEAAPSSATERLGNRAGVGRARVYSCRKPYKVPRLQPLWASNVDPAQLSL
jgi:hypothetical protein